MRGNKKVFFPILPNNIAPATQNNTWNIIYNTRSNRGISPTSPNAIPVTQNNSPDFRTNFSKTITMSFAIRDQSDHNPKIIQAKSDHKTVIPQPRLFFTPTTSILYYTTLCNPAIIRNFSEYCAYHKNKKNIINLYMHKILFIICRIIKYCKYCTCHEN